MSLFKIRKSNVPKLILRHLLTILVSFQKFYINQTPQYFEFLDAWELIYNPNFNAVESDRIKKDVGTL